MLDRLSLWFRYEFERFLMRGPFSRLLMVAWLIVVISIFGGMLAFTCSDQFPTLFEAIWWSFLRLTDPGYLGDDKGVVLRVASTVITVLGYVLFMGSLVAIMTQWFLSTMRALAAGVTPIVRRNHIVIIGSTNRTTTIVHELFSSSGRVKRFLRLRGTSELHVAILSEREPEEVIDELKSGLGDVYRKTAITVRHGSPLKLDHLRRVDFLRASAILVPADDERGIGFSTRDEESTKILLAIGQAMREESPSHPPVLVAEVSSDEKAGLARRAYGGDSEIVPTEQLVAWMIAQEVKCPGTLKIFDELLAQGSGHRIYLSPADAVVGKRMDELAHLLPEAIVMGLQRGAVPLVNPGPEVVVEPGDRLIAIAPDLKHVTRFDHHAVVEIPEDLELHETDIVDATKRVLLLGWSRKVPALIDALGGGSAPVSQLDIFGRVPVAERETLVARACPDRHAMNVRHLEGDVTSLRDLSKLELASYDHIILVASDRLESDAESDARTILSSLAVDDLVSRLPRSPRVLVEILYPENARLLQERDVTVVQSAVIPSMLLTQVCLYRELHAVIDDIVRPGGAEIRLVPPDVLGIPPGRYRFVELFNHGQYAGVTVLGVVGQPGQSSSDLVPGRDAVIDLEATTELVVLFVDNRVSEV